MRLSRLIFVIAVVLISGLMAASEVPEILTLTDNSSNDYVFAWQRLPGWSSQQMLRDATGLSGWLAAPALQLDFPVCFSSSTSLKQTSPPLLSMLGVQLK
jgi:hypothetical protein